MDEVCKEYIEVHPASQSTYTAYKRHHRYEVHTYIYVYINIYYEWYLPFVTSVMFLTITSASLPQPHFDGCICKPVFFTELSSPAQPIS